MRDCQMQPPYANIELDPLLPRHPPMDHYMSFVSTWLGTSLLCVAWAWILYRASQVIRKPTDELISILGIEVPLPPTLSLAGIKADGFVLHWKTSEQKNAAIQYRLYVNGVNVGEIFPNDASIAVSGLEPDRGYAIRILANNSQNFVNASEPLRIRTRPESTGDFFASGQEDGAPSVKDAGIGPTVKPFKGLLDTITSSQSAALMQREPSGNFSQKRGTSSRRQTQTTHPASDTPGQEGFVHEDSQDKIRDLTEKLDRIRAETDSYDSQLRAEEEKYNAELESQMKLLREVQQQLQDKNNVSKRLNQQVAALVNEESAARKSKAITDKQLQNVAHERAKMRDNVLKWEAEAEDMEQGIDRLREEEKTYVQETRAQTAELKEELTGEIAVNKTMEESIRQTVTQIKDLEEEKKKLDDGEYIETTALLRNEGDDDWKLRVGEMMASYHYLYQQLHQAKAAGHAAQQTLDGWKNFYYANSQAYHLPQIELPTPRRRRAPSLRSERGLQPSSYDLAPATGFSNATLTGTSPSFSSLTPYFSVANGMAHGRNQTPVESDHLAPGPPTSPTAADGLLPSGLLGDDSESKFASIERSRTRSLHESQAGGNVLPGLGAPETLEDANFGPGSPASLQSQSPSALASPRESATHLPFPAHMSSFSESERAMPGPVGSGRALGTITAGTKFSNLFGIGKQRAKTTSDEGPALGALKLSESQSFPRYELEYGDDALSKPRGAQSTSWVGHMLGRSNTSSSMEDPRPQVAAAAAAKRRFNVFGASKNDPWLADKAEARAEPAADGAGLPRPSVDTQSRFGWPVMLGGAGASPAGDQRRNSHLGVADWGLAAAAPAGWSSSRLQSLSAGGLTADDVDDGASEGLLAAAQAPIGTRPRSSHAPSASADGRAAKLNPTAPSFKTLFSRTAERKGCAAAGKKDRDRDGAASRSSLDDAPSESSRLSSSIDLDAASLSDAGGGATETAAAPAPRESFMRKLTRKSSAGFHATLTGRKGRSSAALATMAPATLAAADATDDEDKAEDKGKGFRFRTLRRRKGEKEGEEREEE